MQTIRAILSLILFITLFTSDTTKAMNSTAKRVHIPMAKLLTKAIEDGDTKALDTVIAEWTKQKTDAAQCVNTPKGDEPSFFITAVRKGHVEIVRRDDLNMRLRDKKD